MWQSRALLVVVSSAVLVVLAVQAFGDSKDDLSRAKSDYDSMKSRLDDEKLKTDKYLDASVKLRQMDKDQLTDLINQICRLDIERNDDEPSGSRKILRSRLSIRCGVPTTKRSTMVLMSGTSWATLKATPSRFEVGCTISRARRT